MPSAENWSGTCAWEHLPASSDFPGAVSYLQRSSLSTVHLATVESSAFKEPSESADCTLWKTMDVQKHWKSRTASEGQDRGEETRLLLFH